MTNLSVFLDSDVLEGKVDYLLIMHIFITLTIFNL